jgi:hypothetical protein
MHNISKDCPKKMLKKGKLLEGQGDCLDRDHSDQMVLGAVRRGGLTP